MLMIRLFFSEETYDLSRVGRMKVNARLARPTAEGPGTLTHEDIVDTVKVLVELRNGRGEVDDIDHLGNCRVRCVGELAYNQFFHDLVLAKGAVRTRSDQPELDSSTPTIRIHVTLRCDSFP